MMKFIGYLLFTALLIAGFCFLTITLDWSWPKHELFYIGAIQSYVTVGTLIGLALMALNYQVFYGK
jgi:asparagine N-glycosylation enzyme membrane subunit Stt3